MKILNTVCLSFFVISLSACGPKTLSRENAFDALSRAPMGQIEAEFNRLSCFKETPGHYLFSRDIPFIRIAAQSGLFDIWPAPKAKPGLYSIIMQSDIVGVSKMKKPTSNTQPHGDIDFYVTLTDKGRPYLVSEQGYSDTFLMATLRPVEILSVGESSPLGGKTMSMVSFKYLYEPTPFGKAYDDAFGERQYSGWAKGTARFSLNDNGWKFEGCTRDP